MKAKRSSIELMVLSFVLLIAQAFSHDADQSDRVIVVTNEGSIVVKIDGGDTVVEIDGGCEDI